ncbi:MAG TPA: maleate cis-trans isomerase [Ornithinimicrobium sp.]|uniref:maleate cis-trans isomerase family protein n=1 Tax=Ornithinimicrobium sp. TaxID=1977084 RepID=UPI002B469B0C|nr:maleate cis-trans isomerase [Ornithinimicrobium sp.]HKJ11037.1 maleate cis-trans isomerase [Ornithinimicrobium sp.]
MTAIGLLYPGESAADDYRHAERILAEEGGMPVRLPVQVTSVGEDAHRVDALLDLGSDDRLAEGAARLARDATAVHGLDEELDAVIWACTSGSFVFGWDGAHDQVDTLARSAGVPASSTSLAFARALGHLDLTRVAVAASYPRDVAEHFVALLAHPGVEVTAMSTGEIITAEEVGRLDAGGVASLVRSVDLRGAQALLVPDTAMHTLALLTELERIAGMPVLTANQVTVWEGLRLAGAWPHAPGLGSLFTARVAA